MLNVRRLYDRFNAPVMGIDCGQRCAPHNPSGKPFCCDICQAVPAAYHPEWTYLRANTDLWRAWRGDECEDGAADPDALLAATPASMLLLACKGPARCQRPYRALSCRQFPFFPYITADDRFIGLAYEWEFEPVCWVLSNLGLVSDDYRREFVEAFDALFAAWPDEYENYVVHSEQMRAHFSALRRRIPVLHRRGGLYLLSPRSDRLARTTPDRLPRFGPYRVGG